MRKKIFYSLIGALLLSLPAVAQQSVNIVKGNVAYSFNTENVGLMTYSNGGKTLTILDKEFSLSDITSINVRDVVVENNTVLIEFDNNSAMVSVAGNLVDFVGAEVSGAHVVINQSDNVSDKTCGEITYILTGNSADGSFTLKGSFKATIELQGLTLTNPSGEAINIDNGKRIELSAKNGTVNTLIDGSGGKQKAALYCKGHLELKGKGSLNVTGKTGHAVAAKEYIEMKNLSLNILGAPKDGINCTQYFLMESGTLNITGIEGDGIQVDYKDAEGKREAEDTGSITIQGGTVDISITGPAAKGFKSEGDFVITGGEVAVNSSSPGEWDSEKLKTKASSCVGADGNVNVKGGAMTLMASGGGGKGISCENDFIMDGGNLNITTSGGALVYSNGTLSQNYTGSLDRIESDYKSSPKGIKADGKVEINDGTIYVKTIGNNGEGIESKTTLTINGGDITVRAKDDGINSSSHMYIKGGKIDVIATGNDGLDSNGNMYISGGVILAFGAGNPECGLDANEEEGYSVVFTGGYILGVGGRNSVPSSNSGSTQPYVSTSGKVTGGTEIIISSGSDTLYTFQVPEDYTSSSSGNGPGGGTGGWGPGGGSGSSNLTILISTPDLVSGQSYSVKSGSNSATSATAQLTGSGGWGPGGRN